MILKWIRLFIGIALIANSSCFAMYAGNAVSPDMPEDGLFSRTNSNTVYHLSYTYDHTLDRTIKFLPPLETTWIQASSTSLRKNGANIGISFGNQLELFGSLGSLNFSSSPIIDYFDLYKKKEDNLYFGGGANVILVFFRQCTMGISAKYHASSQSLYQKEDDLEFKGMLQNWQLSFTLGREFIWINPYVGFAFDSLKCHFYNAQASNLAKISLEEFNPWVCVLGIGLVKNKLGYLNVEGRLIGEMAFALRASLSF
ncbi:hypothetical protein COB21_03695 [Candidatus Aerophobetes bacterium]|uniref:Transporter n=1 Tax=Aerophobetes bacterium TaxID=2030807 RepID=A0A2A4X2P7_UNCAE|nr:MAG: hypothetical protein COB21_03695 [Candidatus Aerophobetes bacterium]